jgi:hypothetical protein
MLEGVGAVSMITPRRRVNGSPPRLDQREQDLPWAHLSMVPAAQPIKDRDVDFDFDPVC